MYSFAVEVPCGRTVLFHIHFLLFTSDSPFHRQRLLSFGEELLHPFVGSTLSLINNLFSVFCSVGCFSAFAVAIV